MPTLYDALPIMKEEDLRYNSKEIGDHSYAEKLDDIKMYYELGSKIFGNNKSGLRVAHGDDLVKELIKEENNIFMEVWDKYEYIPYHANFSYKNYDFPILKANDFPISYIHKILELAKKLKMIILPIELVGDAIETQKYANRDGLIYAIERATSFVKKTGSYMYILCPLSYYNVWKEIEGDTTCTDKYYPEDFDAIFTTIDLMIPAQRNLYKMIQTNASNIDTLKRDMNQNLEAINSKIKSIEKRLSFIEDQMKLVIDKMKEEDKVKDIEYTVAKLEKLVYCLLDPLVFFTKDRVDFTNVDPNTKVHIVACFGPEFPVDIFVNNGINIIGNNIRYRENDIVFPSYIF